MSNNELTTVTLPCQSPYRWEYFLQFQSRRLIEGMEWINGDTYTRTVTVNDTKGYFSIKPDGDNFAVTLSERLMAHQQAVLAKITSMFDLATDTTAIEAHLRGCYPQLPIQPGLHIPGVFCPFEAGIRAICGQRISVAAATRLVSMLAHTFANEDDEGRLHFPKPDMFSPELLASIPMMKEKRRTFMEFAQWCLDNLPQEPQQSQQEPQPNLQSLLAIRGVGSWTVDYIKLCAYNDGDIWIGEDLGIRQALQKLGGIDESKAIPYRSYLTLHLWNMHNIS